MTLFSTLRVHCRRCITQVRAWPHKDWNDLDDRQSTHALTAFCFFYHRQFHNPDPDRGNSPSPVFLQTAPRHSLESATFSAGAVILFAIGSAIPPQSNPPVQLGETLEQSEAFAVTAAEVPRRLEESSAQDGVLLFLVLSEREGYLLRPMVDPVVELEDEHLDEDDETDEGEGAARLGQDALVVDGDVG